jgi:hypothetical protein
LARKRSPPSATTEGEKVKDSAPVRMGQSAGKPEGDLVFRRGSGESTVSQNCSKMGIFCVKLAKINCFFCSKSRLFSGVFV